MCKTRDNKNREDFLPNANLATPKDSILVFVLSC